MSTTGAPQHRNRHADGARTLGGAVQDGAAETVPGPAYAKAIAPTLYGGRMRRELDEVRHLLNDPERLGSSAGYFVQLLAGVGWSSLPAVLSGADSFTGSPDDAREA